jgi:uncharacterized protein involved in response to NO
MPAIWSVYAAAPHRVLFLPGFIQGVLVMVWWLIDLESRRVGGAGLVGAGLPASLLHGWLMIYGMLPLFVFGFLFTAAPNWLSGPAIPRSAYLMTMAGLSGGALLMYFGHSAAGLALHLVGWSVALRALLATLRAARDDDRRHAWAVWAALALGAAGELLMLAGLLFDQWQWLRPGLELGLWGCLTPLFLSVAHRMIPWFTSRVVANYVLIRPYSLLWAMWAGCLLHYVLATLGHADLTWLVDGPMTALAIWFSGRWGLLLGFRERLLAMLHIAFLWAAVGFALYGLESLAVFLDFDWSAGLAPLHALGIGLFSAMLIGMASRVSLGHSGRALRADAPTWWLFWSIQGVALLRMAADIFPESGFDLLVSLAGLLWLVVFAAWAWKYAPMTWRPRIDGKSG